MTSCTDSLYLERRDAVRNMARYYSLGIESDLFEGILAVRRWGRIGGKGRRISLPCPDLGAARAVLSEIEHAKRRRGYAEPG